MCGLPPNRRQSRRVSDVRLRSAYRSPLAPIRTGAPRVGSLSPALGTSDYSSALPGSGTQVNGVSSR